MNITSSIENHLDVMIIIGAFVMNMRDIGTRRWIVNACIIKQRLNFDLVSTYQIV